MTEPLAVRLLLHAGVVLLGWHVAHTGGVDTALIIVALGLVLPKLRLGPGAMTAYFWAAILSGYPFLVAAILAPVAGALRARS